MEGKVVDKTFIFRQKKSEKNILGSQPNYEEVLK
jgi:hypothetical protein